MKLNTLKVLAFSLALSMCTTHAALKYWDVNGATTGSGQGATAGTWNTAGTTWSTSSAGTATTTTIATTDTAVFSAGTDATGAFTINVPSAITATGVTVEEGTVTMTGAAVTIGTGAVTVNSGAKLSTGGSAAFTVTSGGTLTLNGGTYENATTGAAGSFVSSIMGIVVGSAGGTLSFPTANTLNIVQTGTPGSIISGVGGITKVGAGVLAVATACTYNGPTIVNDGELRIRNTSNRLPITTAVTVNSPGILNLNSVVAAPGGQQIGSLSGNGDVGLGNSLLTVGDTTTTTYTGAIKDIANAGATPTTSTGGRVLKVGAGTLNLGGANSFTGSLTNTAGTINVLSGAALCGPAADLVINGGTITLSNSAQTVLSLSGTAGTLVLGTGHTLTVNPAGTRTFAGIVDGPGAFVKTGVGTTALTGPNTFTGKTTVTAGLVQVSADTGFGTAPGSYVADQITLNGGGIKLNATAASIVANRGITLGASGGTIDVSASQSPIINSPITGVGALTKVTSGNLDLVASNSFAGGMLITGGGVRFRNDFAAGTGTITVTPASIVTLRNLNPPLAVTLTNPVSLSANAGNDIDLTSASGATFTLAGNISGAGYLTRGRAASSSGNIVLSGDNSGWTGGLYWGRGLLTLGHKNALGTGTLTCTNLVAGESNVLMSATSLIGANAVTNAVNLTGLLIFAGGNGLELSGPLTLAAGANTITNGNGAGVILSGIIGGPGALTMSGPVATLVQGPSGNIYTGGTIVNGSLTVGKDGGLGSGNVTVNTGATLTLQSGAANAYIASSANLLLNGAAPAVNLAFTGAPNTVNALSFDGGATFMAAGTWGAIGSGAQHTDARFTGTGMLNVTTGPTSSTVLASSGSPAVYGTVTLTATVTGFGGTPTGSVNFFDGATLLGSSPLVAGVATLNVSSLDVAGSPHSLTAVYPSSPSMDGSTSSAISQDITPKTVTAVVTVDNRPYDGTSSASIATRSLTGVVGADDVTLGATGSASFADKDAVNGKPVTVTGLAISGTTAVNYTLASDTVVTSANITKIALTVTGLSASDKVYDGNASATLTGTAVLSAGVVGSEDVTLSGAAVGAFVNKNVGNGKNVNVTGLSLAGADIANYTLTPLVLTANITAGSALTVTGITAENKAYDGTNTATLVVSNAVLVGVISGDDVTLVTTNATGVFSDELVGNGKTVAISGLTLAGVDATNYSLTQPTATADIRNGLGVSGITASDKVYDATTAASIDTSGAALVGVIGADDVTLVVTSATGAFGDKNVGIGKTVTISGLTLVGVDASKYLLTNITATASISMANLTVTGLSATSKTYDSTTTAAITGTAALAGVLLSDVVTPSGTAAGTFATKNVGTGISVSVAGITLAGADAGNYSLTQPTLSADINAVSLTITGLSAVSKTYDAGTNAAITGTAALSGIIGLEDVSVTGTAAGSFADKTVGLAKPVAVIGLSLSGADAGNYTLASLTLSANISQLVLTQTGITALNKVYDATTTVTFGGTMTVPGILGGDVVTLSGTPVGSFGTKDVGIAKSVGFGGVFLTGADAGNYDLQLQLLSADITAAPLTVTGLAASDKAYDGTNTATVTGTPALSGVISNDVVTLTGTASGTFSDKNVGIAKAVTVSGLGLSGADAGNYSLTQPTLSASITASGLTVTGLSGVNKVYDTFTTASVTGTAALAGVVAGDVVSVTGTPSGSFADKLAGIGKAVTVTGLSLTGADAGNYTLTQPTLSADITPAPLTVSGITADNKVYDATTAATFSGTGVLSGILTGDTVTLGGTPGGSFGTKDAGIGKSVSFVGVFPTGPDAANYDLQLQLLSADITPAALTVTGLSAVSKVYDATLVASVTGTPALAGVILGDDVTLTGVASGSFTTKTVGVAKTVTVSGLGKTGVDAGNYTLTLPNLSADITSATLTITGLSASNKVYDGTTSATVTGTAALADIQGSDVVSTTGTAAGTFADKNVGTGKNVAVTGLTLTGGDAGNYTLAALTLTADITSLASSNALVSSINPSEPGSNVTFTATLAGTPPAADAPTGDVVFLSNGVAFSTNSLVSGVATASTVSLATGTNTISAEYAGDVNFTGSTNSLEQVVASLVTCSAVNTLVGIGNNNDGTFTLTFQGTPQAEYYIVTSTDVTTPIASWTVLAGSTNAVTNLSGAWSFTVTNATPQQFYRSAAVVPCQ